MVLQIPRPSPAGLTKQVGFIRLAHLKYPKSGKPDSGWSTFFARTFFEEDGLQRNSGLPELCNLFKGPQVGQARLAVSSPAMTNLITGTSVPDQHEPSNSGGTCPANKT